MNVYIGGSLFTDKQINQRITEEKKIKEVNPKAKIYNPITNDEINDKTKQPTAQDIFLQDTKKVIESDIITADLDDTDEGLAMELGIAYGINYLRGRVFKIFLSSENIEQDLLDLLKEVPHKYVVATYSDIRQDTKGEEGVYKSVSKNQFLIGGVERMGHIYRHFEDTLHTYKELSNE